MTPICTYQARQHYMAETSISVFHLDFVVTKQP